MAPESELMPRGAGRLHSITGELKISFQSQAESTAA